MAVSTIWMALAINSTPTSTRGVTVTLWTPSWALCHPADFHLTHWALHPVTSRFLLNYDPTLRTVHSFAFSHHFLQSFVCLLCSFIVACLYSQVFLILLTVLTLMNSLAREAVLVMADLAVEEVDLIVVETESRAVGSLAVEGVIRSSFCSVDATLEVPLVVVFANYLFYFSIWDDLLTISSISFCVRALYLWLIANIYVVFQALSADLVEAFP